MGVWIEELLSKRGKTNETFRHLLHDGELVEDPIFDIFLDKQQWFKHAREIMLDGE